MFADVFHDLRIEEDQQRQRNDVGIEEDGADEKFSRRVLSHVVEAASRQETLCKSME